MRVYVCVCGCAYGRRFISGKEWFVAAPKNRFCDGNDFDAVCKPLCECLCLDVCLILCVFALECFADQMHLLFNSPSQQAALTKYMHTLAHARLHTLRYKHTE